MSTFNTFVNVEMLTFYNIYTFYRYEIGAVPLISSPNIITLLGNLRLYLLSFPTTRSICLSGPKVLFPHIFGASPTQWKTHR